jgi:hypothetical protein
MWIPSIKVEFLDHVISKDGICMNLYKFQTIVKLLQLLSKMSNVLLDLSTFINISFFTIFNSGTFYSVD